MSGTIRVSLTQWLVGRLSPSRAESFSETLLAQPYGDQPQVVVKLSEHQRGRSGDAVNLPPPNALFLHASRNKGGRHITTHWCFSCIRSHEVRPSTSRRRSHMCARSGCFAAQVLSDRRGARVFSKNFVMGGAPHKCFAALV